MKGKTLTTILAIFIMLALSGKVQAAPSINSVEFVPDSTPWVGESLTMRVNCTDSAPISSLVAQISADSGFSIPNQTLSLSSGLYQASLSPLYLTSPGNYTANFYCTNNLGQQTSQASSFMLSNFTISVSAATGTPYVGDQLEFNVIVKKNNVQVISGVDFSVLVDGSSQPPVVTPPYDPSKGWVVYMPAQTSGGNHEYKIIASYDGTSANQSKSVTVLDSIQFNISRIDKLVLKGNDTVTLDITALEKGVKIPLNSSNLAINVGSVSAPIQSVASVGNYFTVTVYAPERSPGTYTMSATLTHGPYTYLDSETVSYNVPIEGRVTDASGKGISAEFRFKQNDVQKLKVNTGSDGTYSATLPPGDYDIEADFPNAKIKMDEAEIDDDFDDEINYYELSSKSLDGLKVAAVHVFEISLKAEDIEIEMKYDESKVDDESELRVYRCSAWSKSKGACTTSWREISAFIDTISNKVTVSDTGFAAYAIGSVNSLSMTLRLDDQDYPVGSPVKLSGVVIDKEGNIVGGATVKLDVKGTGIKETTTADSNGLFSFNFPAPDSEGNFTASVTAEKPPFESFTKEARLQVVRQRTFTIVFPDTIRIEPGVELAQNLKVVNTGQSNLAGLRISIEGIPGDYFVLPTIERLDRGEERNVPIMFSVPVGTPKGTHSATLKIQNIETSREKVFGFTVTEPRVRTESEEPSAFAPVTGFLIGFGSVKPNQLTTSLIYVGIFAACAFTASFFLKRYRMRSRHLSFHGGMRSDLYEIKNRLTSRHHDQGGVEMWNRPVSDFGPHHVTETEYDRDRREKRW